MHEERALSVYVRTMFLQVPMGVGTLQRVGGQWGLGWGLAGSIVCSQEFWGSQSLFHSPTDFAGEGVVTKVFKKCRERERERSNT